MLWIDANEANRIPIKKVAELVVPDFGNKGRILTGRCIKHTDNKLGNFRLKNETDYVSNERDNYAHCFTCGQTWYPVSLVMEFRGLKFQEALEFLYENFPSYFTNVKETKEKPKWNGLSNDEYKYLGINIQQVFGNIVLDIREFAREFPEEHDIILINKVIEFKKRINDLNPIISQYVKIDKLEKDYKKIGVKLFKLLKKGLISKKYKNIDIKKLLNTTYKIN